MKILAIDYGDARTGVAVSDLTGSIVGYTTVIHSWNREKTLAELVRLVKEQGAEQIVMGFPRNMDGSEGPRAELYRAFAADLESALGITWYKSNDDVVSMGSPFDSNYVEYANFLKDAYIVETSTGYTVTCQMRVEEEGFKLQLNCEIYLDTEGSVTGYKMFLDAPVEEEIEGMNVVMSKYDIDFETDCPEIELPAEALNAKE